MITPPNSPFETGVEIARPVHLGIHPRFSVAPIVVGESRGADVVFAQGVEDRFGREHSRFDREVDAFEPHAVEKPGRVADEAQAVGVQLRHGVQTAHRNGLGAVT